MYDLQRKKVYFIVLALIILNPFKTLYRGHPVYVKRWKYAQNMCWSQDKCLVLTMLTANISHVSKGNSIIIQNRTNYPKYRPGSSNQWTEIGSFDLGCLAFQLARKHTFDIPTKTWSAVWLISFKVFWLCVWNKLRRHFFVSTLLLTMVESIGLSLLYIIAFSLVFY